MNRVHLLASDNASGVHPAVLAKLVEVNRGHALAYGADPLTHQVEALFQRQFGEHSHTWLLTTGTAANVLALKGMARSHQTVYCSEQAHLRVDECGAVEHFVGCPLTPLPSPSAKLDPAALAARVDADRGLVHRSQPRVLSLSQATERGTLYQPEELRELITTAHRLGLWVHMDGARLANAAAALDRELVELSGALGVDALSLGGTKNGLMLAEALVVFTPELQPAYPFIRKQGMQLASKQRFLAAQFLAYFEDELWRRNAQQANAMARYLGERLASIPGVRLAEPVAINMVFARLPNPWIAPLQRLTPCLVNPGERDSEVRLVTAFDSQPQDIDHFVQQLRRLAGREPSA